MMRHRSRHGFTLVELLTVLAIVGMLAAILIPKFTSSKDRSTYTACGENLTTLAGALQVYANENDQQYPAALSALVPAHIGVIPTCPAASSDTYTAGYDKSDSPATYTVLCSGNHHETIASANEPYYVFGHGLGP